MNRETRIAVTVGVVALAAAIGIGAGLAAGIAIHTAKPDVGTPNSAPAPERTQYPEPIALSPAESCQEDQPCWDCTKMGNHICGAEAAPDGITKGTIWPCIAWSGEEPQVIPANVRQDVCMTTDGNYSYPFDN
jgi:hypothetical protein